MKAEELKSTLKDLSKIKTPLFISLVAISGYVIQRSYIAFLAADITSEHVINTQQQVQVVYSGLNFSYGTMNIFWPFIICMLMLLCKLLMAKQVNIWQELKGLETDVSTNFDAINIYKEITHNKTGIIVLKIAAFLPLIALITHLLAGVWIMLHIVQESTSVPDADDVLLAELLLQVVVTLFSIILIARAPGFIIRAVRTYQ